jgi:hypothetical protein
MKRADLLEGTNAMEKLGFTDWKKSRNWRSMGFYGHWTTYAEVLQLIASLTFGLFIALFLTQRRRDAKTQIKEGKNDKFPFLANSFSPFLLFFCLAAMALALLLNVFRLFC